MTLWANESALPVVVRARIGTKAVEFACEPGDMVEIPEVLDVVVLAKAPQLKRAEAATATKKDEPKPVEPKAIEPKAAEQKPVDDVDPFTGQKVGGKRR